MLISPILYRCKNHKFLLMKKKSYRKEVKTTDGKTIQKVYYGIDIRLSVHTTIQLVENSTSSVLYEAIFSTPQRPNSFRRTDIDEITASRLFSLRNGGIKGINTYVIDSYNKQFDKQIKRLKTICDFEKTTIKQKVYLINTKKAPNYAKEANEIQALIQTIQNSDFTENITENQQKLYPILQSWKQKAKSLNTSDKNQQKLKFMYQYNRAVGLLFLEKYDEAISACEEITGIKYKRSESFNLKQKIKTESYPFSNEAFSTKRHLRQGFTSTSNYVFTPSKVKKAWRNPVTSIKNDIKEFREVSKNLGVVTYSAVQDLEQGIQKSILRIYKDSVDTRDNRFSKLQFTEGGVEYKFGKIILKKGNGYLSGDHYQLAFYKPMPLIDKAGLFSTMKINFYTKNGMDESFDAKSFIALLEKYKGTSISDISTGSPQDTVYSSDTDYPDKTFKNIDWNTYGKDLAVEVEMYYTALGCRFSRRSYISTNGDKFTFRITDMDPVKVDHGKGVVKEGYMATFEMDGFQLTKYYYNNGLKSTEKNYDKIEFKILIE